MTNKQARYDPSGNSQHVIVEDTLGATEKRLLERYRQVASVTVAFRSFALFRRIDGTPVPR